MAPDLQSSKIAFIGGGNMAAAIIGGLLAKSIPKQHITVAEPWEVNRDKMAALGVNTTTSNADAFADADIALLAVKPQVAKGVCEELAAAVAGRDRLPVVVSIAAGITLDALQKWLTLPDARVPHVVRVMPNTPALVGEGASGLFAGSDVTEDERQLTESLMASVSKATEWVDREELIDVVTGLSGESPFFFLLPSRQNNVDRTLTIAGSGPAYFFAMVEHLIASAVGLGLSPEQAKRLAAQTCLGAGKMLVESPEAPSQLRKNVTSPNGTTHAGLQSFEASGFADVVDKAVKAATARGEELGRTLGNQ
ncbi:pyrroline-5-carboxylate reductase [Verticillium dahliae]